MRLRGQSQAKEILTVRLGRNQLDSDYTFYEDGTIEHLYDRHAFALNIIEKIELKDISGPLKGMLLKKCEPEDLVKLKKILKVK